VRAAGWVKIIFGAKNFTTDPSVPAGSKCQGVYLIRWDFNEVFMFHVFKK
jgi:hypothetical protein